MFNLIDNTIHADAGEIWLDGRRIDGLPSWERAHRGLGRTFQITRLFREMTVLENVVAVQRSFSLGQLGRVAVSGEEAAAAEELLEFVGMRAFRDQRAHALSYGQQKLVELAQILMLDPKLIMLDEPAGGINPVLIERMGEMIRELNSYGKTFLIVEHNMPFVLGCVTRSTCWPAGRTMAPGTPEQIQNDPAVIDAYLGDDFLLETKAAPLMLTLTGVVAGYGGGDVLQGVDIDVEKGSVACIVGPNGAGKSTVLRTVSGLLTPRLGEITSDGEPHRRPRRRRDPGARHLPGAAGQRAVPEHDRRENVLLGAYIKRRDRALVKQRYDEVPSCSRSSRTQPRQRGNLSGGQRRMVEFARSLMLDPVLLLLDEPSLGLDPKALQRSTTR